MNKISEALGYLCKVILPIHEEYYLGNPKSDTAICTLASLNILKSIKNSDLFDNVNIVGRLLTENKGIDEIIRYLSQNKKIKKIIICGKEVWGHKAGHSLIQLHKNGTDKNNRIIGSKSPDPILTVKKSEIKYFQEKIKIINLIGETKLTKIFQLI